MSNKIVLTAEQEEYLVRNYKTMTRKELGLALGLKPFMVLRQMGRLNLVRTPEEKKALISKSVVNRDDQAAAKKKMRIEGGHKGNPHQRKSRYHKDKWIERNGAIPKNMILVYENAKYDEYNDLVLIQRRGFNKFVRERDKRLKKEERDRKRKIQGKQIEARRKAAHEQEDRMDKFLSSYKQKSPNEAALELMAENKVPVKIDHRTTIWVKREKCIQLENGTWVKKENTNTKHHNNEEKSEPGRNKETHRTEGFAATKEPQEAEVCGQPDPEREEVGSELW